MTISRIEALGFPGRGTLLERDDPVILGMGSCGIHRGAEAAVLPFEVLLRDPTGTATEPSNRNPDVPGHEEVHQFL